MVYLVKQSLFRKGKRSIHSMRAQKISVFWVSSTILDLSLNRMAFLDILEQFSKLGHKSSLIAVRSKNAPRIKNPQEHVISVPLRRVPLVLPVMFTLVLFIFLPIFVAISTCDIIVMEPDIHVLSAFPAFIIAKFKKTKFVLDIRSTPVETIGFRGFLQKLFFSVAIVVAKKLFDGMTIITPLMKQEVCKTYEINPAKVGVWTTGVSDSLFNPENFSSERVELKGKLGLSEKFVVFYHGGFSATRGLTETVEALELLRHKYPDIVFFLLGSGPALPLLRTLVHKDGLQNNVFVHNPVEQREVPKFIAMSDVCIVPLPYHPYWRFQCPLKLLEYLAMEKTVIVSDIPAHRSIIGDKRCGIYVSPVKPAEIAQSIEYAYRNKDKLVEWGKVGRTIIQEKYEWEKVAKDLENYLLSI